MRHSLIRYALLWALFPTLAVFAQNAGMVLGTSVTYNTQRASLPLSDEQRRQAEALGAKGQQAGLAGQFGEALRYYYQGQAVMRNVPWTPVFEFASSLQGRLDHALVEPGKQVMVSLTALYKSQPGPKLKAEVLMFPANKDGSRRAGASESVLARGLEIDPTVLPFQTRVTIPETAPGDYSLEARLTPPGDASPAAPGSAYTKTLPLHVEALSGATDRLRARIAKDQPQKTKDGFTTAEYALALYEHADQGEINPNRVNFGQEFAAADAILDELEAGHDPYAAKRGDMRKAYRSAVDGTLQPYRLLIPESYKATEPASLVVALHGMGGDENSMFDFYDGQLKRAAERLGFVVVCPKGRDTTSMYRGSAEQDVMDAIADVRRDYAIDPDRIYLMGHSMGGYGTWSVAMAHPDVFAALGPISGGGDKSGMVKIARIPEYVVHGDDDRTVPVTQSRMMVEAGKKAGANITYVEVPGGSHVSVAAPSFAPMLDFFSKQAKAH
jgi:pimeloyl-ACP methyl ester carboxylesterase